jgi:hypothetical protein
MVLFGLAAGSVWASEDATKKWSLEGEGGWIIPGYNVAQIPRETGTRISLKNDLNLPGRAYYRLRLNWRWRRRHTASILVAPLTLPADGALPVPVRFAGVDFAAGAVVDATYRFNSYRLTYRYTLVDKPKVRFGVGLTAKIRDAEISLRDGVREGKKTDLGFVPLLNLHLEWRWTPTWGLVVEADALASPGGQGRAEDAALAVTHTVSSAWQMRAGYRIVEGGADVESVYNFALINYLFAGFRFSW